MNYKRETRLFFELLTKGYDRYEAEKELELDPKVVDNWFNILIDSFRV